MFDVPVPGKKTKRKERFFEGCEVKEDRGMVYTTVYCWKGNKWFKADVPSLFGSKEGRANLCDGNRVVAALNYSSDKLNGECIWYFDDGSWEIVEVKNDWKDGEYTIYYRDGLPIESGIYSNGTSIEPARNQFEYDSKPSYSCDYSRNDTATNAILAISAAAAVGYGLKKAYDYYSNDRSSSTMTKSSFRSSQGQRGTSRRSFW